MFEKTWEAISKDFKRLNPFDSTNNNSDKTLGLDRGFNTTDTIGRGLVSEKYEFKQLTYPLNLFMGETGALAPYMMIFINSRTGDSYNGSSKSGGFITDIKENEMRVGSSIRGGVVKDKNTVVGTMGLLSTGLGGAIGGVVGGISGAGLGSGAGLLGAVVLYNTLSDADFKKEHQRLSAAVALHMPNQLDIRYGMQYKNDNAAATVGLMNAMSGAVAAGTEGGRALKNYVDSKFNESTTTVPPNGAGSDPIMGNILKKENDISLQKVAAGVTGAVKGILGSEANRNFGLASAMQLMPGGDTLSATVGLAPNPKLQTIFEGVDARTFSYSYSFFPKNQEELDNVYRITRLLKYHMHPSYKGEKEFLFNYPSTFNIEFFVGRDRNEYLHRHTGCVLTNMSIDYTPNGQYIYHHNGAPVQINVRMDFRELEILTSDDIAENY